MIDQSQLSALQADLNQALELLESTKSDLSFLKHHDPMTKLHSRHYFEQCLNLVEEDGPFPASILFGNLNGLSNINTTYGQAAGDCMLVEFAQILTEVSRPTYVAARLSGDEFALIMPHADHEEAKQVSQKIRYLCLKSTSYIEKPDCALGYATRTHDGQSMFDLLIEAEDNMQKNKLTLPKSSKSAVIRSLQTTLVEKSIETREHGERIRSLAVTLGKAHGLMDKQLDELSLAALMHDIGKIGVPDALLSKEGMLTDDEWLIIKRHPEVGYNILNALPHMNSVAECVLCHHEKWDGSGYPRAISEENIPLNARIITLVDAFDVMTHNRPYCTARTAENAYRELLKCSGTHFDPMLVHTFLNLMQVHQPAQPLEIAP